MTPLPCCSKLGRGAGLRLTIVAAGNLMPKEGGTDMWGMVGLVGTVMELTASSWRQLAIILFHVFVNPFLTQRSKVFLRIPAGDLCSV